MNTLTIGQLAHACGVGVETIRFYERQGLLPAPPRSGAGYRHYPASAVQRLSFIRRAKELGFTLKEISELLLLQDDGQAHSRAEVKAIAEARLAEVTAKIHDLERVRTALTQLAACCSGEGPVQGCPIIEALTD